MGSEPQFNQSSINHFSHPHPLQLSQQAFTGSLCSGCKNDASGLVYCCTICSYFLHQKCSQMPRQITHLCDPNHVFSLQPKPIYPGGLFNCNACGQQGNGFSYHCQACGIDFHLLCASLPMVLWHQSHHHQLNLTFSPPSPSRCFSCNICQKIGCNQWLYRCNMCEFDVHLTCTNMLPSAPSQPPIQQSPIQRVQNLMTRANPQLPSQNSMSHNFISNVNPAVNDVNPVINNINPAPYNSFGPSGIGQAQPPVFGNPYAATTPVQQNSFMNPGAYGFMPVNSFMNPGAYGVMPVNSFINPGAYGYTPVNSFTNPGAYGYRPVNSFVNPGAYGYVRPAGYAQQNSLLDRVVGALATGASQAIAGAFMLDFFN